MKKDLLGYKLKEECEKYKDAALKIIPASGFSISKIYDFTHESIACKRLKKAGVMHWFEEVYKKKELEVGKWYKGSGKYGGEYLMVWNDGKKTYGFYDGNFDTDWRFTKKVNNIIPATEEEVKESLIKEAKMRGFKEGVKVKSFFGDDEILESRHKKLISFSGNCLNYFGVVIFLDGKWAEIIEEPKNDYAIIDGKKYKLTLIEG